jgi:hypothetical protein
MTHNTILEELHAARRQILADYNGDTAAYLRDAQKRLEASGRPIARRQQRSIQCAEIVPTDEAPTENHSSPR